MEYMLVLLAQTLFASGSFSSSFTNAKPDATSPKISGQNTFQWRSQEQLSSPHRSLTSHLVSCIARDLRVRSISTACKKQCTCNTCMEGETRQIKDRTGGHYGQAKSPSIQ